MRLTCPHLGSPVSCGEKNLSSSVTVGEVVYFTTYVPAGESGSCGPSEGAGLLYAVRLENATAVFDFDTSRSGLERFDLVAAPGIPTDLVPIGDGKLVDSGLQIRDTETRSGLRSYWYTSEP
jgi:hypothetical protein